MGLYDIWLMPRLCHLAMRSKRLRPPRQRVVGAAEGDVLEIGIGSGLNFPYYGPNARRVFALEPSPHLIEMARRAAANASVPAAFIEGSAEQIPLDAKSVDTVLMTWVGCSIPDIEVALREMRRVLRAGWATVVRRARPLARRAMSNAGNSGWSRTGCRYPAAAI